MDTKQRFFKIIHGYYYKIVKNELPAALLNELSEAITKYYYEQYSRFGNEKPKSTKRYSSFQTKDLDHPYTFEIIIKFFKEKVGNKYPQYVMQLLPMTKDELKKFEKNREDFYNIF